MDLVLLRKQNEFHALIAKIEASEIRSCDGFKVKEPTVPVISHYFTFAETDIFGNHWFFITMSSIGYVKKINQDELWELAIKYDFSIKEVIPFPGYDFERQDALRRGNSVVGEPYRWVGKNCENLMNYIQTGKSKSVQTRNASLAVSAVGAGMTLSKNKGMQTAGVLVLAVGLIGFLIDVFGEDDF